MVSLPARGAWIEIWNAANCRKIGGRSPRGERGLKCHRHHIITVTLGGRSPRGERGLKFMGTLPAPNHIGRSPRGESGLKFQIADHRQGEQSRSPYGERGLKSEPDEALDVR